MKWFSKNKHPKTQNIKWFDKTWRKKNGKYIHDGDCNFWDKKICTCGLLHQIMPCEEYCADKYNGSYYEDRAAQTDAIEWEMRLWSLASKGDRILWRWSQCCLESMKRPSEDRVSEYRRVGWDESPGKAIDLALEAATREKMKDPAYKQRHEEMQKWLESMLKPGSSENSKKNS